MFVASGFGFEKVCGRNFVFTLTFYLLLRLYFYWIFEHKINSIYFDNIYIKRNNFNLLIIEILNFDYGKVVF